MRGGEPAGLVAEVLAHLARQAQVVEAAHRMGHEPEHRAERTALEEDVRAEPAEVVDAEGEVELEVLFEAGDLVLGEHAVDELLGLLLGQRVELRRLEEPVHPDPGR